MIMMYGLPLLCQLYIHPVSQTVSAFALSMMVVSLFSPPPAHQLTPAVLCYVDYIITYLNIKFLIFYLYAVFYITKNRRIILKKKVNKKFNWNSCISLHYVRFNPFKLQRLLLYRMKQWLWVFFTGNFLRTRCVIKYSIKRNRCAYCRYFLIWSFLPGMPFIKGPWIKAFYYLYICISYLYTSYSPTGL